MIMRLPSPLLRTALALLLSPAPALAQCTVELVLEQDQTVVGAGDIDTIDNLAVNGFGAWRAWVDTDGSVFTDEVVIDQDLNVILQEGVALPAPAGASVLGFDSLTLDDAGGSLANLRLTGTAGSNDDSGLYFGDQLVIQEGDGSTAPGFGAGTVYKEFREVKANAFGEALAIVTVDDPDILSTSDRALVRIQVDGAGNLVAETVVAKEGTPLPGMTSLADFGSLSRQLAFNNAGQALFLASGQPAQTLYLDQTPLIAANTPSPIPGRNYSSLSSVSADLNDQGDWVAVPLLTGTQAGNQALIKNGTVLVQKGETHPEIAPFVITSLGSGPVHIDNQGRVLWYAAWSDGSATNEGWFLDDELIVQEGVTLVNGTPIFSITGNSRTSDLSDDGGFFLFSGRTDSNHNALFRLRLLPLTGGPGSISVAAGGRQDLELCLGSAHAGNLYLVAGSLSGTSPGTPFPSVTVPLNLDAYAQYSVGNVNLPPFENTFGVLDGQGAASAAIDLPPGGAPPGFAGLTAHHAAIVLDPVNASVIDASNPVPLTFVN